MRPCPPRRYTSQARINGTSPTPYLSRWDSLHTWTLTTTSISSVRSLQYRRLFSYSPFLRKLRRRRGRRSQVRDEAYGLRVEWRRGGVGSWEGLSLGGSRVRRRLLSSRLFWNIGSRNLPRVRATDPAPSHPWQDGRWKIWFLDLTFKINININVSKLLLNVNNKLNRLDTHGFLVIDICKLHINN